MALVVDRLRQDAIAIYAAGVAAVEPRRALARALATTPPPPRVSLIAVGKAAAAMAAGAVAHLAALDVPLVGGVVVSPDPADAVDGRLCQVVGGHPLPDHRSAEAADAVAAAARRVGVREEVWVLLSGGATSLIGAPASGVSEDHYRRLIEVVGRLGLPIAELNQIRKRFSRWGGGRLLAALPAAPVRVFALSDVIGDDPADIGSGPCEPDPTTAGEVRDRLTALRLDLQLPPLLFDWLDRVARGDLPETPKPFDPIFNRRTTRIIASNATAISHAAGHARSLSYQVELVPEPIRGDAAPAGATFAAGLIARATSGAFAWIGGGETTVRLEPGSGTGGRCQEFALAAAATLGTIAPGTDAVVLAAGTDGRDGPTDAAGAVVDQHTLEALRHRGVDPGTALAQHNAYSALDAVGRLLKTGLSGTNAMDLMIGLATRAENVPLATGSPGQ